MSEEVGLEGCGVLHAPLLGPFKLDSLFYEFSFILTTCIEMEDTDERFRSRHVFDRVVEEADPSIQGS